MLYFASGQPMKAECMNDCTKSFISLQAAQTRSLPVVLFVVVVVVTFFCSHFYQLSHTFEINESMHMSVLNTCINFNSKRKRDRKRDCIQKVNTKYSKPENIQQTHSPGKRIFAAGRGTGGGQKQDNTEQMHPPNKTKKCMKTNNTEQERSYITSDKTNQFPRNPPTEIYGIHNKAIKIGVKHFRVKGNVFIRSRSRQPSTSKEGKTLHVFYTNFLRIVYTLSGA